MNTTYYLHTNSPSLEYKAKQNTFVQLGDCPHNLALDPFELALRTWQLANRLGIKPYAAQDDEPLPYQSNHDNLVYDAALCSKTTNKNLRFLRGWNKFDSCVKGFNSLGLIAEHWTQFFNRISSLEPQKQLLEKIAFLKAKTKSNKDSNILVRVFSDNEIASFKEEDLVNISLEDVALWQCVTAGPFICSTSSNMGISLHQALRYMQELELNLKGKTFNLLNKDEGSLIIWCPDEEADFMNSEKTETLRALENELPALSVLHTYINRKERDPGALKDALETGGYFFPTNPQSKEEMQSFLIKALDDLSKERNLEHQELLLDPRIRRALESLRCEVNHDSVIVRVGVEGGLNGLMIGYLLMLEESISERPVALSTWNQASIGAALAAAVLADRFCHNPKMITEEAETMLSKYFPAIHNAIKNNRFGKDINSRIHGIFDIANLQSLAQLLGVVVERHISGRGTPFVGLGSSSYANGNLCFKILDESKSRSESFRGKDTFHPTTHTITPLAQALIFADDWHRGTQSSNFRALHDKNDKVAFLLAHARKAEPAGAAALSGYLLVRLDDGTLSLAEIAYTLSLVGFDSELFLTFIGTVFENGDKEYNWFLQEATEEGKYMEQLANQFLALLDLPLSELKILYAQEKKYSQDKYSANPVDSIDFEELNPIINIYLTGDNTTQPDRDFGMKLFDRYEANETMILSFLE